MSNIRIELEYLKKASILTGHANGAIILFLLYEEKFKELQEWLDEVESNYEFDIQEFLLEMEEKGLLKIIAEIPEEISDKVLEFRQEFLNLVTPNNSKINFDEFWDIFPTSTKSGRALRAENKIFHGKPTRDYEVCKQKYLSKVKDEELHKEIVAIIKKRVELNQYEYINGMEVYINQRKWEQDIALLRRKGIQLDYTKSV
jgi:hypothetical protein